MARVLGYGGIAATNGARSFAGKAEAVAASSALVRNSRFVQSRGVRVYRSWYASLAFLIAFVR